MFLLVMSETLALFVDTLTADDKYSLCNRENLQQKIQVHLSKKKRFFRIFCSFGNFFKQDDPPSLSIFEITDSERRG